MANGERARYVLIHVIGEGGMAVVELVWDTRDACRCVRKRAKKGNVQAAKSVVDEGMLLQSLHHPLLPQVKAIMEEEHAFVMEYIEGASLAKRLSVHGTFGDVQIIAWGIALCEVLSYLHAQTPPIIYRDMKPDNILQTQEGNLVLIDFGAARRYRANRQGDTCLLGTKGFAAPEQYGGMGQSDVRSDVYALGATLYQLWDKQGNPRLARILRRAASYAPSDRYESCEAMRTQLQKLQKARFARWRPQSPLFYGLAITLSLCLGVAALYQRYDQRLRYRQLLESAVCAQGEESWFYCMEAMAVDAQAKEAYLLLIWKFREDAHFDLQEEVVWKQQAEPLLMQQVNAPSVGQVAYALGELYWYCYGDGIDQEPAPAAMIAAIPWFAMAQAHLPENSPLYQHAQIYQAIGSFYREIVVKVRTSREQGSYRECLWQCVRLQEEMSQWEMADTQMRLQVYQMTYTLIGDYLWELKADGVSEVWLKGILSRSDAQIAALSADSEREQASKQQLLSKQKTLQALIENAYASS